MKDRPFQLCSDTYKIKPVTIDDAIYVTVSNGEIDGVVKPVEIFINCKNMQSFQWVSILQRLLAHEFSKPGGLDFKIIEEMKSTFDPSGGYVIPKSNGKWANSIVAHVGFVLENHCVKLGLISKDKDV